jgi:hypothetical protein
MVSPVLTMVGGLQRWHGLRFDLVNNHGSFVPIDSLGFAYPSSNTVCPGVQTSLLDLGVQPAWNHGVPVSIETVTDLPQEPNVFLETQPVHPILCTLLWGSLPISFSRVWL